MVTPGPPLPLRSVSGFIPEGKILIGELRRRGVPTGIALKFARLVRGKGIYNVAGDWFNAEWFEEEVPVHFEYFRRGRFILFWEKGKTEVVRCGSGGRKVVWGTIESDNTYFYFREKLPPFVVNQVWYLLKKLKAEIPLPSGTRWSVVYRRMGKCPDRILLFHISFPQGITSSMIYFPYGGNLYWNERGQSIEECNLPPVPLEGLILYRNGRGLFYFPSVIFAPFRGVVDSLSPLLLSGDVEMKCVADGEIPGYLERGSVAKFTILRKNVKKFRCSCTTGKQKALPPGLMSKFYSNYLSLEALLPFN